MIKKLVYCSLALALASPVLADNLTPSASPNQPDRMASADANAIPAEITSDVDSLQRRRRHRRSQPARWYFAGCVHSDFDCRWLATWYGYRYAHTEWDIRCNAAPYACYIGR
jgi:hypothetical protein